MSFHSLPLEIVCLVVTLLDFADVLNLRLTSRTVRALLSEDSINARLFSRKQVSLTVASLTSLVRMTSPDSAGCALQHCTITGVIGETLSLAHDNECKQLLATAFRNLKNHSPEGRLASLRLDVNCSRSRHSVRLSNETLKSTWETAIRTFNVTMTALQESALGVDGCLNIFADVQGCSLPYDVFVPLSRQFAATAVFSDLKQLSVSLSSPVKDHRDHAVQSTAELVEENAGPRYRDSQLLHGMSALQGLLDMSTVMPSLKSLSVHWYNLGRLASRAQSETSIQMKPQPAFTRLDGCRIRGVHATATGLLQFLTNLHPKTICLADIVLKAGTYAPIFSYITAPGSGLVHFGVPGIPKFPYSGTRVGPSTLERRGDDAKEAIRYSVPQARALGSPYRMQWLHGKYAEYGSR
ncbi:hypothetical protein F5Y17DRAFT_469714 [Xylariaceae sp. FL0594]|nr:hypothetical protein F5Y17DRAFT_469714 [Xylariaceae sp. FL0594]